MTSELLTPRFSAIKRTSPPRWIRPLICRDRSDSILFIPQTISISDRLFLSGKQT